MNTITMEEAIKIFEIGSKWKHFKGYILTIIAVAKHTETDEILIIYNCENPDDSSYNSSIWARPVDMFFESVDKTKYPNINQTYRIERII